MRADVNDRPLLLLVDDDVDLLFLLQRSLDGEHDVVTARNGEEALEVLTTSVPRPDLIVSDLRMPQMRGDELLRHMQTVPELKDIPVILLTGADDRDTRLDMLSLGVADYINKPFPPGELQLRVRNTLRGALLLREVSVARQAAERANAELREVNEELDRFAAAAAHDLQAPLANIAGFAGLLRDGMVADADQQTRLLDAIAANAVRAEGLVRNLLHHARTVASVDEAQAVELADALDAAVSDLEVAFTESGADLAVDRPLHAVRVRPVAIESIMLNLLSNAIKYRHPDRAPAIHVRSSLVNGDGVVEVVVQDNGRGLPASERQDVFGLGHQGTNREVGTGIGLATVRAVVARHGGSIWLEDAPDPGGLSVHFTLPAA